MRCVVLAARPLLLALTLLAAAVLGAYAAQGYARPLPVSVGEWVYSERGELVGRVTRGLVVEEDRTRVVVEVPPPGRRR